MDYGTFDNVISVEGVGGFGDGCVKVFVAEAEAVGGGDGGGSFPVGFEAIEAGGDGGGGFFGFGFGDGSFDCFAEASFGDAGVWG